MTANVSSPVKWSLVVWVLVGGGFLWQQGCSSAVDDITIADGAVLVRNQSDQEWRDVRIWVNDYYSGGARSIPAGGFVREPLSKFVAAQGQKLNAASTAITSVVVLAKTPGGEAVRMVWGKPFWH
jgi:hypothetical protein